MKNHESFIMRTSKFIGALLLMGLFTFVLAFIISYLAGNDILDQASMVPTSETNNI